MPTPRKSTPPTDDATDETPKEPTDAAEKAANEATTPFDPDAEVNFEFRGVDFTIKNRNATSFRFQMARAANDEPRIMLELLGMEQADLAVALAKPGEGFFEVAAEIFEAYGKASGSGNS